MTINLTCTICTGPISDLYYLTVGEKLSIHLECLKCSVCSAKLEMQTKCYINNGKFYCLDDYLSSINSGKAEEPFSDLLSARNNPNSINPNNSSIVSRCKTCTQHIDSGEYVIRIRRINENDLYDLYHPSCFQCFECRSLIAPGDKYGITSDNTVFCGQHYLQSSASHISKQGEFNFKLFSIHFFEWFLYSIKTSLKICVYT
jgi:hypothetical protein